MKKVIITRNKNPILQANLCQSFLENLRGFMFRKKEGAIVLTSGKSIHMFFVFFPLYIYWIDENFKVVDKRKAQPFHPFITTKEDAKFVLESTFPLELEIGDQIEFLYFSNDAIK